MRQQYYDRFGNSHSFFYTGAADRDGVYMRTNQQPVRTSTKSINCGRDTGDECTNHNPQPRKHGDECTNTHPPLRSKL